MSRSTLPELTRALNEAHPGGGFDAVIEDLRFVSPEAMAAHSPRVSMRSLQTAILQVEWIGAPAASGDTRVYCWSPGWALVMATTSKAAADAQGCGGIDGGPQMGVGRSYYPTTASVVRSMAGRHVTAAADFPVMGVRNSYMRAATAQR